MSRIYTKILIVICAFVSVSLSVFGQSVGCPFTTPQGCTTTVGIDDFSITGELGSAINTYDSNCDSIPVFPPIITLAGNSYNFSIVGNSPATTLQGVIYVDWNGNNDFQDSGEFIDLGSFTGSINSSLPIPAGQAAGIYNMMIVVIFDNPLFGAPIVQEYCDSSFTFLEFEEYQIEVQALNCVPADLVFSTIDDCNNNQFDLVIDTLTFGSASALTVVDNNGFFANIILNSINTSFPFTVGTFTSGTLFNIDVFPDDNVFCNLNFGNINSPCPAPGIDCVEALEIDFQDCTANFFGTFIQPNSNSNIATSGNGAQWFTFTPTNDAVIDVFSCGGGSTTDIAILEDTVGVACTSLGTSAEIGYPFNCATTSGSAVQGVNVTAGNTYYIEWGNGLDPNPFNWNIDFTCSEAVSGLSATLGADSTTQVDLSFVPPATSNYILEYGVSGFLPGSGTVVLNPGSPYTVMNLSPNVNYDFYVVTDCFDVGMYTACSTPVSINTSATCIAPTAFAFPICTSPTQFEIEITLSDLGSLGGNTQFEVLLNGQSNNYNIGQGTIGIGSYMQGTFVDVSIVGDNDPTCFVDFSSLTSTNCDCFGTFSNDNCVDADLLPAIDPFGFCDGSNVTIVTDLTCANPGFESGSNTCDPDNDATNNHDVFYEFVSPSNGNLSISVNQTSNNFNIAIFSVVCPGAGGPELFCTADLFLGDQVEVTGMAPNTTYYMQIWGNAVGPNGAGLAPNVEICLEEGPSTAGTECTAPTVITLTGDCVNNIQTFSNLDQTPANIYASCDPQFVGIGGINYDVWFSFEAPANGSVDVYLDNLSAVGYTFYALFEIDPATNCVGTEIDCGNGFGISAVINQNYSNLIPGDDYLLQVWTHDIPAGPTFNIFDICLSTASCVPPVIVLQENCNSSNSFTLDLSLSDLGIGNSNGYQIFVDDGTGLTNTNLTVNQTNTVVSLPGTYTIGSFITVELVGIDDATCPGTLTIQGDCTCFGNLPSNDECVNAIPLTIGTSLTPGYCNNFVVNGPFNSDCATAGTIGTTEFDPTNNFGFVSGASDPGWFPTTTNMGLYHDATVWYSFQGTGNSIEIELMPTGVINPLVNGQMALFESCPGTGGNTQAVVFTDLLNPGSFGSTVSFTSDASIVYYLAVDHSGNSINSGEFTLNLCQTPPPCTLNSNTVIESYPCNPQGDGTFFVTGNFFYQDISDSTLLVYANSVLIDTIIVNPNITFLGNALIQIPQALLLPNADLTMYYEFANLTFCNETEIIPFALLPDNCLFEDDEVLNQSLNGVITNSVDICDGQQLLIEIEVENDDNNWPVQPTLTLNGAFVTNLTDGDNDGVYTATITEQNTGCAPIVNNYTVTTITLDFDQSGDVLDVFDFTATIFPTSVEQFFTINTLPNCQTEVTINPICGTSLVLNSSSIMTGSDTGVFEFDYQYTASNNCVPNTGTLFVPFTCFDCPLVSSVNFSETEICNGESITFTAVVDPPDADNLTIVVTDILGATVATLLPSVPGSPTYQATITPVNNSCATIIENYTLTATCTDNNSLINVTTQLVNVYPNNIQQFLDIIFLNDCSASVQVNPLCAASGAQNLILNSPTIQNANAGTFGTFDFAYQFNGAGNGCFNESGILSLPYDCPEITTPVNDCFLNTAGLVASNFTTVCAGDFANVNALNPNITGSNILTYVLHNGSDFALGNTTYGTSFSGVFNNDGSYPTNVELCISAVVGGTNGNSVPSPVCDVSNCFPIVFLTPISILINDELCNNFTNEFTVSYSVSGGAPSYNPGLHSYDINIGTEMLTNISSGQQLVSAPIFGAFYSIDVIQDGKGCSASVTTDSVVCGSLPIELVDFDAFLKSNGNLVKWEIANAIDVDQYSIRYSSLGYDFEEIATIDAEEFSSEIKTYSFLHEAISSGAYYYQLVIRELNGDEKVAAHTQLNRREIQIFDVDLSPNPANKLINLKFFTANSTDINVNLFANSGKQIQSINFKSEIGNNIKAINLSDLPSGLYFIKILSEDYSTVHRFIKE